MSFERTLGAGFEVAGPQCFVTLFSFGDQPSGAFNFELWRRLRDMQGGVEERREVFLPFGGGAACLLNVTADPKDHAALLAGPRALWDQELSGFRALRFAEWLSNRKAGATPTPMAFRAIVSVTIRTDLLLEDGHLVPTAVKEALVSRLDCASLRCDPWLSMSGTDLFFILRSNDLHAIGKAVDRIRNLTLGDLFPADPSEAQPPGPFTEALRGLFRLRATAGVHAILTGSTPVDLPGGKDAEGFVRSLRVFVDTRTLVGTALHVVDALLAHCQVASEEVIAEARGGDPPRDPIAWTERVVERLLGSPDGPFRKTLDAVSGEPNERVPAFVALRARPGRERVLRPWITCLRDKVFERLEGPSPPTADAPPRDASLFGAQDVVLLDGTRRGRATTILAMLVLLTHLAHRDPCTGPRFGHVLRSSHTVVGFCPEETSEPPPHELGPFLAEEFLPRDDPGAAPRAVQHRLQAVSSPHWERLAVQPTADALTMACAWLPQHLLDAAVRLLDLYNIALQDPTTAFALMDLRPSVQTLVQILNTARLVPYPDESGDRILWEPIPSLHGGAGRPEEVPLEVMTRNLVRVIHMLDLAIRQRTPGRAGELAGGRVVELLNGRTKWLSGLAVLVPALQELHTPEPYQFRYPGFGVLGLSKLPIVVLTRGFALVQVGPEMLGQPERLILLIQELGHVALRAPRHQEAARAVEQAVAARLGDAKAQQTPGGRHAQAVLMQLLSEAYCDLTLLFLGFDGDIEQFFHFMLRRFPSLMTSLPKLGRVEVLERLFLVSALFDRDVRSPSHPRVDLSNLDGLQRASEHFYERVSAATDRGDRDPWRVHGLLAGGPLACSAEGAQDADAARIWRRLTASCRDAHHILSPQLLSRFSIGRRTVANWFDAVSRQTWDRALHGAHAPAQRPIPARNLQRAFLAPRDWAGLRHLSLEDQRRILAGASFPLVVPSDIDVWLGDARAALARDEVSPSERVALLYSAWTASLGYRALMLAREEAHQRSGRVAARGPGGPKRAFERGPFVRLFELETTRSPAEAASR